MSAEVYMVHKNWAGACFVKTLEFFERQGGNQKSWGKAWHRVVANSIEDARRICKETIGRPYKSETASVLAHSEDVEKRAKNVIRRWMDSEFFGATGATNSDQEYAALLREIAAELAVPAAQPESAPPVQLNTQALRAKLKDAGFDNEEVGTIEILISQSMRPTSDADDYVAWLHGELYDAGWLDVDAAASIIEAELGGQ